MAVNSFGERLAQLRNQKELSQYKLAELLGFSRGQVANYEQGTRQPDFDTLKKLAAFFNVTTDYLLGRTNDPHGTYLPPNMWPAGPMVRVPVLGRIRAGLPILADEHIEGWELAPADEVKDGRYFYLRVTGDSMIKSQGQRIFR